MKESNKEKVLKNVTKEFQSTSRIFNACKTINYYEIHNILKELQREGKVEQLKNGLTHNFWRLK